MNTSVSVEASTDISTKGDNKQLDLFLIDLSITFSTARFVDGFINYKVLNWLFCPFLNYNKFSVTGTKYTKIDHI